MARPAQFGVAVLCLGCQLYDPSDLTGAGGGKGSETAVGGTQSTGGESGGPARGGAGGSTSTGGSAGSSMPDAGEAATSTGGVDGGATSGGAPSTAGSGGTNPDPTGGAPPATAGAAPVEQNLLELRVEPADAVLSVGLGEVGELQFHAYGTFEAEPDMEYDLTERSVFYVPDNYLVGTFPADGTSTFATWLPAAAGEPAQRGGLVTIEVRAGNADGTFSTASTTLTVLLEDGVPAETGTPAATPALPEDLVAAFDGTAAAALDPTLVYPNDGVVLPQNLGGLEVHFLAGTSGGSLFQVTFLSEFANLRYYTRCYSDPAAFEPGACALLMPAADFASLAASNPGGSAELSVSASDEAGGTGLSLGAVLAFTDEPIDGALYYWSAAVDMSSDARGDRFDFGSIEATAETFLTRAQVPGASGTCMGCHVPSRQGDKLFFSLGSSSNGQLEFIADMTQAIDAVGFFTYSGGELDLGQTTANQENRVLLGAFSPDGAEFVATAPANDAAPDTQLFFHDGETGLRAASIDLPFIPGHPDWSASGDRIAVTAIGTNRTGIEFTGGGISIVEQAAGGAWDAASPVAVVPAVVGKNRYAPAFLPDDSLLVYTESDQSTYAAAAATSCEAAPNTDPAAPCDGYADPGAKTWAVEPASGATPIFLANAAAPGVADELTPPPQPEAGSDDLLDTHPRPAPFAATSGDKTLYFVSIGSQRRAGLRLAFPNMSVVGDTATQTLLWMFALDPASVVAGDDGSYAAFFLPFQDFTRSQHVASWTERIVSESPPPRRPAVPPLPPPPPDPPLPE